MFEKVLVANRGEIAIRIMRTLKNMGIKTVAVYSEADTNALHVKYADEAIYIGPSAATESYLSIPNIINAIRKSNAEAVHPGYGFLSENYDFAKALKKEGVVLIGPSAKVVKTMGDKIEAKKIAQDANVSTVPGYIGIIKNPEQAVTIAEEIGFPVMIKAAAGGGGRGMRVVYTSNEVVDAYASASREAGNSFSDDRIFIEKFIETPRHIEIQLLADQFGHAICLGERECSIQRHHQKVIEEAPSPFLDNETRQKMYDQVLALAAKVKYFSAGTVEFIMDVNKNFYFLEMNTRLQVEHCVTELITGIDIVEQMVLIAYGERLKINQEDIKFNGWAIESRIYSEDPTRGFIPSSGRIIEYTEPPHSSNVRVDSGVKEGYEVSMFYDPMIAKLCTHASTRELAIKYMKQALGDFVIKGISHNISFIEAIMSNENFIKGDFSTNFIDKEYPGGFLGAELTSEISKVLLSTGLFIHMAETKRANSISGQMPERNVQIGTRWVISIDEQMYPIFIKPIEQGFSIRFEKKRLYVVSNWVLGSNLFKGIVNNKSISVKIDRFEGGYILNHAGVTSKVRVRSPRVAELEKFMPTTTEDISKYEITSPIAGKVMQVNIAVGDIVKPGQEVVIIEAMKMENSVTVDTNAIVKQVFVKTGESVLANQVIIELDDLPANVE
jgi:propionyl-CoA carboxylase alpha chain